MRLGVGCTTLAVTVIFSTLYRVTVARNDGPCVRRNNKEVQKYESTAFIKVLVLEQRKVYTRSEKDSFVK